MSKSTEELRKSALYHMNTGVSCFGLSFLGGSKCPVDPDGLTIDDLQVAHLRRDKLFGDRLYKKVLELKTPLEQYVPLCVLCNWRMRDLNEECFKFDKTTRLAAVRYAQKYSGNAAGRKFGTSGTTVRGWAHEFGEKLRKNKKLTDQQKLEIVKFSFDEGITKASEKFSVSHSSIQSWRKRGL
jgi:hypothetical protein